MSAIENILPRLEGYRLRENGRDRWRSCCPAHGGKNPSALSIGVGDDGRVLVRCWNGCTVEQVVHALGLELDDLFPPRDAPGAGHGPIPRRRLITAGQALNLLNDELTLTVLCAADMARGVPIEEGTRQRLIQAAARVTMLRDEVHA